MSPPLGIISRAKIGGLLVILLLLPALALAGDVTYVVKRGDSLYTVARDHGVTVDELAERNGIARSLYLKVGQSLLIPQKNSKRPANPAPRLPASIQRAIDRAPVKPGRWQFIVIHHSGVDAGTVKAMDTYHREVRHMENGLAYDFVIGNGNGMNDGEIAVGPRWTKQLDGGHLASEAQNKIALGICLVGNFDEDKPSVRQLSSLRALIQALMVRCKLDPGDVKTHQQINIVNTRCPGSKFPAASFIGSLKSPATTGR